MKYRQSGRLRFAACEAIVLLPLEASGRTSSGAGALGRLIVFLLIGSRRSVNRNSINLDFSKIDHDPTDQSGPCLAWLVSIGPGAIFGHFGTNDRSARVG